MVNVHFIYALLIHVQCNYTQKMIISTTFYYIMHSQCVYLIVSGHVYTFTFCKRLPAKNKTLPFARVIVSPLLITPGIVVGKNLIYWWYFTYLCWPWLKEDLYWFWDQKVKVRFGTLNLVLYLQVNSISLFTFIDYNSHICWPWQEKTSYGLYGQKVQRSRSYSDFIYHFCTINSIYLWDTIMIFQHFYASGSNDRGHIVFILSVCLSVSLFVCLLSTLTFS